MIKKDIVVKATEKELRDMAYKYPLRLILYWNQSKLGGKISQNNSSENIKNMINGYYSKDDPFIILDEYGVTSFDSLKSKESPINFKQLALWVVDTMDK